MAGDSGPSSKAGFARHFDTLTMMGRRNCTVASYALYFSIYVIYKVTSSKKSKA